MIHIIQKVYENNEHRSSDKPNSISATTLLGPLYKGKLALEKAPQDESLVDMSLKRSSAIGTAFHEYASKVLEKEHKLYVVEQYMEREIEVDGKVYTISGSCDGFEKQGDGSYTIFDWKTAYGKERKQDQLDKDAKQMSIYRWLFNGEYNINDIGYTLFISQSNNTQEAYPVKLMSLEETQHFIEDKLFAIENNENVDCNDGVRFNMCDYCSYECQYRQ